MVLQRVYVVILLAFPIVSPHHKNDVKDDPHPGQALFLTSFIEENRIEEAREQSRVHGIFDDIVSYSGFLTVNKKYNSNMFFWFFPAMEVEVEKAAIIVYLNGGPGFSSMNTIFTENGPFMVNKHQQMSRREDTWAKYHSIIYIDSPVGAGYSFTEHDEGYPKNQRGVANDLYAFLVQFCTIFSELQRNEFYVAGESYGGKYAPSLAKKIHDENQKSDFNTINLKGITIGNGFTHPLYHVDRVDIFYQLGLIGINNKSNHEENVKQLQGLILEDSWDDAMTSFFGCTEDLCRESGYSYLYNLLDSEPPQEHYYHIDFLSSNAVKKMLHAGHTSFFYHSGKVYEFLWQDFLKSAKPEVEFLLQNGYRVLFYNGLLDLCVPYASTVRLLDELEWEGSKEFQKARRRFWHVDGELAGYVQEGQNLMFVGVRNAGHMVPYEQPKVAERLIREFVSGRITSH